MLKCPFHSITGLDCPFCGMQRSFLALLDGNFSEAFLLNPAIWCLMPYFVLCSICAIGQLLEGHNHTQNFAVTVLKSKLGKWAISNSTILGIMLILIAWCIVRNTFGFESSNFDTTIN